jgi:hypothetical protein
MASAEKLLRNMTSMLGSGTDKTLTQKVLGWIAFFVLILVLFFVLYMLFTSVTNGYSRTFRDFLQMNMSHKVDVKNEFAGRDGTFHKTILYLTDATNTDKIAIKELGARFDVIGNCEDDSCGDVFTNFTGVLDKYYEPEFRDNKLGQALADYISYHDKLSEELALKELSTDDRIKKVNFILDGITNYMDKYAVISNKVIDIVCRRNEETIKEAKELYDNETKQKKEDLKQYLKTYGMREVSTNMQFAKFFTDPGYIAGGGTSLSAIYDKLLEKSKHDSLRKDVQKIVNSIRLNQCPQDMKDKTPEECMNQLKIMKLRKEIEMARIRKSVMEQARQQKERENIENNIVPVVNKKEKSNLITDLKKTGQKIEKVGKKIEKVGKKIEKTFKNIGKKKKKGTKEDTKADKNPQQNADKNPQQTNNETDLKKLDLAGLTYAEDQEDVKLLHLDADLQGPLTSARTDRKSNTIYVPCFDAYLHYVDLNSKKSPFRELLATGMGKHELVTYLFLSDLDSMQSKSPSATPPFIVRLLKMYCAMENIALCVRDVVTGPSNIRRALNDILLDTGENSRLMKLDLKQLEEQPNMSKPVIKTQYTLYALELLVMVKPNKIKQVRDLGFEGLLQMFTDWFASQNMDYSNIVRYAQKMNTYMNLTTLLGNDTDIAEEFGSKTKTTNNVGTVIATLNIDKNLQFVTMIYPLFSTVFLSSIASLNPNNVRDSDYQAAVNAAKTRYDMTRKLITTLAVPNETFVDTYDGLVKSVHALKRFMLYAHLAHIYFSQYRHSIVEKNKLSKTREEHEGFVELYTEQTMSDEQFFKKLITPFYRDFIQNRVFSAWKKAFYGPRFDRKNNLSYWIEFDALWIKTLRPKADKMIKNVWSDVGNSAKLRW